MISPRDAPYNCLGDGLSDDSVGLQKWLDAIAGTDVGYGPRGVFCHNGGLIVRSDTAILGAGKNSFILKSTSAEPGSGIRNENLVLDTEQGPRLDWNISLRGIGFHGIPDQVVGHYSDFVTFAGVDGLTIQECGFAHRQSDGIVTANNYNMRITDNEFFDLGTKTLPATPGTGQFVGGTCIFCWRPSYRSWITGNYIHDCIGGGGIWLPVTGDVGGDEAEFFIVTGNQLLNLVEFGIRGAPRGSKVDHNIISGIRNADLDGHGAVMAGHGWSFSDNDISGCDCAGIQLHNPADVSVCNNHISDNNKLGLGYPAISVVSWSPAAMPGTLPPHDCCILGNFGNGGIDQLDYGGGSMSNMDMADNHFTEP
jgi:hypothetical protein